MAPKEAAAGGPSPEFQDAAKAELLRQGAEAAEQAKAKAEEMGNEMLKYIEQGPGGIRVLAAIASMVSIVKAGLDVFGNVLSLKVVTLIICLYQIIFGFTTLLLEAPAEWWEESGSALDGIKRKISKYTDLLEVQAKFLLRMEGRGAFIFFQGTLWLAVMTGITDIITLAVGAFQIFLGILYGWMASGRDAAGCISVAKSGIQKAGAAAKGQYQAVDGAKAPAGP